MATFKIKFTNMGYGPDETFTSLKAAMARGKRAGFEFSVSDEHGIVCAWSPLSGTQEYRAITAAGELREDSPRPEVPFVDVANVTEYGLTQKLSRAIRVF